VKNGSRYPSLWIAIGGALGALSRHGVDLTAASLLHKDAGFPWATFAINLSGAFFLGWILARAETGGAAGDWLRFFAGTGFCGAFTTFSSMNLQMVQLMQSGSSALALVYFVASFVCGIAVVSAGARLGMEKRAAQP
jgi:CrcB protein